jgi:hypothetical protein
VLLENLKKVGELWKQDGLDLAKPLTKNEVIDNFAKLEILISRDIIDVYSNLGGMSDCDSDSVCFSFWTVEKIIEENESNSEFTFFADFLIESHLYGFKFENENVSSIHIYYGENEIEKVAGSFEEFFEIYLTSSKDLYLFERE